MNGHVKYWFSEWVENGWSGDVPQDLGVMHGLNPEREMRDILAHLNPLPTENPQPPSPEVDKDNEEDCEYLIRLGINDA